MSHFVETPLIEPKQITLIGVRFVRKVATNKNFQGNNVSRVHFEISDLNSLMLCINANSCIWTVHVGKFTDEFLVAQGIDPRLKGAYIDIALAHKASLKIGYDAQHNDITFEVKIADFTGTESLAYKKCELCFEIDSDFHKFRKIYIANDEEFKKEVAEVLGNRFLCSPFATTEAAQAEGKFLAEKGFEVRFIEYYTNQVPHYLLFYKSEHCNARAAYGLAVKSCSSK